MKTNKRRLYESIMKDVSRTVKRRLNENVNNNVFHIEYPSWVLFTKLNEYDKQDELLNIIYNLYSSNKEGTLKLLNIIAHSVFNFNFSFNIIDMIDEDFIVLEINDLSEDEFEYTYNLLAKYDGRDEEYLGTWWFSALEPNDNNEFAKWVFDNTSQQDLQTDQYLTFEDFINNN